MDRADLRRGWSRVTPVDGLALDVFKVAIVEAVAGELPLAAVCFWIAFTPDARAEPTRP